MQGKRESIECGINNLVQASICVLSGSGIPMRDCKASARWGAEAKGARVEEVLPGRRLWEWFSPHFSQGASMNP